MPWLRLCSTLMHQAALMALLFCVGAKVLDFLPPQDVCADARLVAPCESPDLVLTASGLTDENAVTGIAQLTPLRTGAHAAKVAAIFDTAWFVTDIALSPALSDALHMELQAEPGLVDAAGLAVETLVPNVNVTLGIQELDGRHLSVSVVAGRVGRTHALNGYMVLIGPSLMKKLHISILMDEKGQAAVRRCEPAVSVMRTAGARVTTCTCADNTCQAPKP